MILVIDNYDSFTFNLVQAVGELTQGVCPVSVVKNDKITILDIKKMNPSHLIISPGPGTPSNAGICMKAIEAYAGKIPIFGICLGYQAMGMVYGATLKKAPRLFHGKTSLVYHHKKEIFRGIPSPFQVMRYHSWIIEPSTLDPSLEITAYTRDKIPMALTHRAYPLFGVQFHPESILTFEGKRIIKNFLDRKNGL